MSETNLGKALEEAAELKEEINDMKEEINNLRKQINHLKEQLELKKKKNEEIKRLEPFSNELILKNLKSKVEKGQFKNKFLSPFQNCLYVLKTAQ